MNKDSKLEQLIDYANMGWKIFPVYGIEDGKCLCGNPECCLPGTPPMIHPGFKDATSEIEQIVEWHNNFPKANWAVATGAISNIIVVTIFSDFIENWFVKNVPLPDSDDAISTLTPACGSNHYFSYPGIEYKWSINNYGLGLYIHSDGEYEFLPPSKDSSGEELRWDVNPKNKKLIPMSEDLMDFFRFMERYLEKGLEEEEHYV